MPSGFKKTAPEPEHVSVEEAVTEPLEVEQCEMKKPISTDVIANVLAVLGKTYPTQEDAQMAVNGLNCDYFQHKLDGYNSLQLCQVRNQWAWLAF